MVRLPVRGTTLSTPRRKEAALRSVLVELCPAGDHSELDIKRLRDRLAIIIGQWSAEQDRLDIAPLVKTFRAMRRDLERIAEILRAHEEGIQETHDFEVV